MRNTNIIHKRTHHPQVRFALPEGDFICHQQKIVGYKFLGTAVLCVFKKESVLTTASKNSFSKGKAVASA